jgi:hypothetical protein
MGWKELPEANSPLECIATGFLADRRQDYAMLQDAWVEAIADRLFPEEIHVNNLILTKEVIHEGL